MSRKKASNQKKSSVLLGIGLFLLCCAALFAYVGWSSIQLEREFENAGVKVRGVVLGKHVEERWDTDSTTKQRTKRVTHYVQYKFTPREGPPIESKGSVPAEVFNVTNDGALIDLQYLPAQPSTNRIAKSPDYVFGAVFITFGVIMTLVSAKLLSLHFKR